MKKELFGFLGGLLIGAAVALLLAPESGEKTRKKIKKFVDDEKDKLAGTYKNVRDHLENEAQKIERRLHRA
jgi:gas vesicle protein